MKDIFTPAIIAGLFRSLLMVVFSTALAKGWIEQSTIEQMAGALGVVVVATFSVLAKRKVAAKLAEAKAQITAKPESETKT